MPAIDRRFDRVRAVLRAGFLLAAAVIAGPSPVGAFPPAPYHTIYGLARNEFGQPLEGKEVKVLLESSTGRVLSSAVGWSSFPGANYVIRIPMDTGLFDAPYHATAMRPLAPFRMKVVVGSTVLLPIEMRGDMKQLGKPGAMTRLDLTLGEDSDGDGLPDAWERILLALLGKDGLDQFNPNDDADGDGLSNRQEYLAGTYASDPEDGFRLELVEKRPEGPVLEFLAIRGRSYTVQSSADLQTWAPQAFKVLGTEDELTSYRAADTRVVRILGVGEEAAGGFFNLRVE